MAGNLAFKKKNKKNNKKERENKRGRKEAGSLLLMGIHKGVKGSY
jgi:hypothetical protein